MRVAFLWCGHRTLNFTKQGLSASSHSANDLGIVGRRQHMAVPAKECLDCTLPCRGQILEYGLLDQPPAFPSSPGTNSTSSNTTLGLLSRV